MPLTQTCPLWPKPCRHRIAMTCRQRSIICTALKQYRAGKISQALDDEATALLDRIEEATPGNPVWILQAQ